MNKSNKVIKEDIIITSDASEVIIIATSVTCISLVKDDKNIIHVSSEYDKKADDKNFIVQTINNITKLNKTFNFTLEVWTEMLNKVNANNFRTFKNRLLRLYDEYVVSLNLITREKYQVEFFYEGIMIGREVCGLTNHGKIVEFKNNDNIEKTVYAKSSACVNNNNKQLTLIEQFNMLSIDDMSINLNMMLETYHEKINNPENLIHDNIDMFENDIENKIGITSKIIELELLLNAENNDYIENTISLLSDTE